MLYVTLGAFVAVIAIPLASASLIVVAVLCFLMAPVALVRYPVARDR